MCFIEQPPEIVQGAEKRVNIAIIGNIVAVIFHRRFKKRRKPYSFNAKGRNIIQLFNYALQIANAVGITILIAAWIYLIHDAAAPPFISVSFKHKISPLGRLTWSVILWQYLPL